MERLEALSRVGSLEGGGVCRLALTDEDGWGRDLVVSWMEELDLEITVDRIGNIVGVRVGRDDGTPVMIGSHLDSVRTGGVYDGSLGVLAGLEVVRCLNDAGIETSNSVAVGAFTNEEGARFQPDMMGSGVHQGSLALEDALATVGIDGTTVEENLRRIGYAGEIPCGTSPVAAYFELHVEQGPILDREGVTIGVVEEVQGISWIEFTIGGVSNHAGTTPMSMRADAGLAAAEIATFARRLAGNIGGAQVATVGALTLEPNLVNVIPERAVMTIDLRNTDDQALHSAEEAVVAFAEEIAQREGVTFAHRQLARFAPVPFAPDMIDLIESEARSLGYTTRRMPSGAGHDAQMFAPNCPTGMIFVPSRDGISHNVTEYTAPDHIEAGADVLLRAVLRRAL
jgi:N-carbamoyl-L-amino-acid hydrolase